MCIKKKSSRGFLAFRPVPKSKSVPTKMISSILCSRSIGEMFSGMWYDAQSLSSSSLRPSERDCLIRWLRRVSGL